MVHEGLYVAHLHVTNKKRVPGTYFMVDSRVVVWFVLWQ